MFTVTYFNDVVSNKCIHSFIHSFVDILNKNDNYCISQSFIYSPEGAAARGQAPLFGRSMAAAAVAEQGFGWCTPREQKYIINLQHGME